MDAGQPAGLELHHLPIHSQKSPGPRKAEELGAKDDPHTGVASNCCGGDGSELWFINCRSVQAIS